MNFRDLRRHQAEVLKLSMAEAQRYSVRKDVEIPTVSATLDDQHHRIHTREDSLKEGSLSGNVQVCPFQQCVHSETLGG